MGQIPLIMQEVAAKHSVKDQATIQENVLYTGFDGNTFEYCPYTETSKTYDQMRKPLGVNVFLGSMAQNNFNVPLQKQRVLDIGCGTGTFIHAIQNKVGAVTGVEYNDGMLAQARHNLSKQIDLHQGSADQLPFTSGIFHACSMNQVLHHFPIVEDYTFLKAAFNEVFRVLRSGGVFHISTSSPEQQRDAFWWMALFPQATKKMMARFPPIETILACLKDAGFIVDGDSISVPLGRALMADDRYLEKGVEGAFDVNYRNGDSSWSMAENCGELEEGLQQLRKMLEEGTAEKWLYEREGLRKCMGQATLITVRKPGGEYPSRDDVSTKASSSEDEKDDTQC